MRIPKKEALPLEVVFCKEAVINYLLFSSLWYLGKYAMRDLVQKLPAGNQQDIGTSDDTIAAVLATLNEVIKKHPEFSR